jgi:LysM repeat protein
MNLKKNFTRLVAVVALATAAIAVLVVVISSLPESGDDDRDRGVRKERAEAEGSGEKFYTVESGDSFSTIAEKEGIDPEHLEQLNPDLDPQALAPGQQVRLR